MFVAIWKPRMYHLLEVEGNMYSTGSRGDQRSSSLAIECDLGNELAASCALDLGYKALWLHVSPRCGGPCPVLLLLVR